MPVLTDDKYELLVEYAKGTCDEEEAQAARSLLRDNQDAQDAMEIIRPVEATMKQLVDLNMFTEEKLDDNWSSLQRSRRKNTNRALFRLGFAGALSAAVIAMVVLTRPDPIGSMIYTGKRHYVSTDTQRDVLHKGETLITDNWLLSVALDSGTSFSLGERSEATVVNESTIFFVSGGIVGTAGEEAVTLEFADCSLMVEPSGIFSLSRDAKDPRIWKVTLNRGGEIQCEDGTVIDIPANEIFVFSR